MASMTRRQFACAMASIVVAGTAPLARRPLKLGIGTYTYHNLSIDDMIAQLIRLKITEIEMSRGEFMLFSRPTPEQFQAVKTKFDRAGIRCVLVLQRDNQKRHRSRERPPVRRAPWSDERHR